LSARNAGPNANGSNATLAATMVTSTVTRKIRYGMTMENWSGVMSAEAEAVHFGA